MQDPMVVPVAMFAYNEERNIEAAVLSVLASFRGMPSMEPVIYVIVNGSKDRTASIVRSLAARHARVHLVELAVPDKCNAWNHYVHDVASREAVQLFMDGDMRMDPDAGPEVVRVLMNDPVALGAVSMPAGGRLADHYRRGLINDPVIYGNLYALKGDVLEEFRQKKIKLPLGTIGDDGLVGFLVATGLDPMQPSMRGRVTAAERSIIRSDPMPIISLYFVRKYYRRRISVSLRYLQFQLLGPRIKALGLAGMPHHIAEVYEDMERYRLPWRGGINWFFDRIAWRRMEAARRRLALEHRERGASPIKA